MATAPVKSRSLHNFSLPRLRWANCNSRLRRRNSPDPNHHQAPTTPPTAELDLHDENTDRKPTSELKNKSFEVSEKEKDDSHEDGEGTEAMPWKLRPRKVATLQIGSLNKAQKVFDERGSKNVVPPPNFTRSRGTAVEGGGGNRRTVEEKKRLWISLSKEEIEEDIYAFTGSKPSRRPRKRPKNVQKLIDNVYPGSYLAGSSLSSDSYQIPDPSW